MISHTKPVFTFIGPSGVGKTTLVELMMHLLGDEGSYLIIDASGDVHFTRRWRENQLDNRLSPLQTPKPDTMASVLEPLSPDLSMNQENIDFLFAELVVPLTDSVDLLTLGPLPQSLSPVANHVMAYGLPRFIEKNYDAVLVDDDQPQILQYLPAETRRDILVITPDTAEQMGTFPPVNDPRSTPSLIINKSLPGSLPQPIEQAIAEGKVHLVGKLPAFETFDSLLQKMPDAFLNCLYRMDLPLNGQWSELLSKKTNGQ